MGGNFPTRIITLSNTEKKQIIKNATIEIEITGPDKKVSSKNVHVMEGGGMFHYAAGFNMKKQGIYQVLASIDTGKKSITAMTDFVVE